MIDWIKKHKVIVGVFCFLIVFGVPIIIHIAYKIEQNNAFFSSVWSAGDLLQYYASILTSFPVVVISVYALECSISARDDANKINYAIIAGIASNSKVDISILDEFVNVKIKFVNYGNNTPEGAIIKYFRIKPNDSITKLNYTNEGYRRCYVSNEDVKNFFVSIYYEEFPDEIVEMISFKDRMKQYRRGLRTAEGVIAFNKIRMDVKLGIYCGGVITPIDIRLTLSPVVDGHEDYGSIQRSYEIEQKEFCIGRALLEKEFLNNIN